MSRLVRAGILTGLVDGLWAAALSQFYGTPQAKVWQYVAGTALGKDMSASGGTGVLIGLCIHFLVAFGWSALFLFMEQRSQWLRTVLATPTGPLRLAIVYGPLIWVVMSAIIIPSRTGKAVKITGRWFIQLAGHALFVGLPITWSFKQKRA